MVVLRDREDEARELLAEHLVELGLAGGVAEAMALLADAPVEQAGVLW